MGRKPTDARLGLGEPWASKLADFCEAHFNAPQKEVLRQAVDAFVDAELQADAATRKRYEALRRKRREQGAGNVSVLPGGKDKP